LQHQPLTKYTSVRRATICVGQSNHLEGTHNVLPQTVTSTSHP
jgi:hypothetical protein